MPLVKSGSKKAFSENVSKEMHAGKPQKQALAIAYSNMRKYGHKMSAGGMCDSCGGECQYAKGGMVKVDPTRHEKGIHKNVNTMHPDKSPAGLNARAHTRARSEHTEQDERTEMFGENAKMQHHKVLKEMKEMPNPKIKGLAEGGPVLPGAGTFQDAFRKATKYGEGGKVYSIGPETDTRQPSKEALTAYDEGGEVEDVEMESQDHENADHELMEACASEFLDAVHKKDKKEMLESLKALIMSIKE